MNKIAKEPEHDRGSCSRCGECCRQGGPALHAADRELLENGVIRLAEVYTIRRGEPARDNIRGRIESVAGDIVKIKSRSGGTTCLFYDKSAGACRIYDRRPEECRVLKCWDTRAIRDLYGRDRLSRQDILEGRHGLWDLVKEHQQTCDYGGIEELIRRGDQRQLAYLIRYDRNLRRLTVEKTGLDTEVLDFLLGRPLSVTIERYGLRTKDLRGY